MQDVWESNLSFLGAAETTSAWRTDAAVKAEYRKNAVEREARMLLFWEDLEEDKTASRRHSEHGSDSLAAPSRSERAVGGGERFVLLQKWEGLVLRVEGDSFWSRLSDLTHEGPDEEAEFLLAEIPPLEQEWLVPGNVFYWTIGYRDVCGQRRRESAIRFRRVPGPGEQSMRRAGEEASRIAEDFGWK